MQQVCAALSPEEAKLPPFTTEPGNRVETRLPAGQASQLVRVEKSYIQFFDFQRVAWKHQRIPLNPNIQVDGGSTWVVLEDGSALICGGGGTIQGWSTVYIVGDRVTQQANMQEARCWHGVLALHINHAVYVFGGRMLYLGTRKSCEKYHLQNNTWTLLPPMQQTRYGFNPCLFSGVIYLCGRSSLLEAFSPQDDLMLPYHLSVPAETYSFCCMYVDDNLLVVHLNHNILKYRAGQQLVQVSTTSTEEDVKSPNSQPVVNAVLRVYYVVVGSRCYCVNMETGAAGPAIE